MLIQPHRFRKPINYRDRINPQFCDLDDITSLVLEPLVRKLDIVYKSIIA